MFTNPKEFCKELLPKLINSAPDLRAFFSTFHSIPQTKSGYFLTGYPDLSVFIHNGEHASGRAINQSAPIPKQALVIIYAALGAVRSALNFGRDCRKEHPQTTVVILTCSCEVEQKKPILQTAMDRGEIIHCIVTEDCGGASDMRAILDTLITLWPERNHK